MRRFTVPRVLVFAFMIGCIPRVASATSIDIGFLSLDADVLTSGSVTFDITNLTGTSAFPPDFPITTPLVFTVTGLTANLSGGGTLAINGSDFTVVDAEGDVNCTVTGDAGSGGCNFAAYTLTSATLLGTLSPTTGLAGLPLGFDGIESAFTATLTPAFGGTLSPGDVVNIEATLVPMGPVSAVPEPPTWLLLDIGLIGSLVAHKRNSWSERLRRLGVLRS